MPARYFGYLDQGHYVNGVAAGLSTKTNKIGFIAAKPIPLGAAQHQLVRCSARARSNPTATVQVDLHRRLVAAGARGGSHQRAGRCRLRRHHLPRRQPEGRDRDRRDARREDLRPQRRPGARSRPRASSPAPSTSGRRSTRSFADDDRQGREAAELRTRRLRQGLWSRTRLRRRRDATRPARPRHAAIADLKAEQADLRRPAQGQQGQGRDAGKALRQSTIPASSG